MRWERGTDTRKAEHICERFRPAARFAGLLQADGYLQRQDQIIHVIARHLSDLSDLLAG